MERHAAHSSPNYSTHHERVVARATIHLGIIYAKAAVCKSHDIRHATNVERIATAALDHYPGEITDSDRIAVRLAALLHDADDRKIFPTHDNHQNTREILAGLPEVIDTTLILRMIDLVSASKNGDSIPDDARDKPWMLYPRHADRLTALGWTGVYRCWKYNQGVGLPLFTPATLRARTEDELWAIATPARYAAYRGDCASMIDHYYDKLLHIGRAIETQENPFLALEARRRLAPLVEVALQFGFSGTLGDEVYVRATALADKEMDETF